jgi:ankyrin repeat protein
MEHGADIDAEDFYGNTPLQLACRHGQVAVVNELVSPNDSNGATTSILGKCKSRVANIEAKDLNGDTPLHLASAEGHLAIVNVLLSGGADISLSTGEDIFQFTKQWNSESQQ